MKKEKKHSSGLGKQPGKPAFEHKDTGAALANGATLSKKKLLGGSKNKN